MRQNREYMLIYAFTGKASASVMVQGFSFFVRFLIYSHFFNTFFIESGLVCVYNNNTLVDF